MMVVDDVVVEMVWMGLLGSRSTLLVTLLLLLLCVMVLVIHFAVQSFPLLVFTPLLFALASSLSHLH
jgi:hypothetical protein